MNEANTFHTMETMLEMVHKVALDELRSQGNEIECAVMLCEIVRVSGQLYQYVENQQIAMCKRVAGQFETED